MIYNLAKCTTRIWQITLTHNHDRIFKENFIGLLNKILVNNKDHAIPALDISCI